MHDWKEIRQRHGTLVFRAAYRILKRHDQALDCYQEVFLEAFERYGNLPILNWPALLQRMAVHRALDRLRQERRMAARIDAENDSAMLPDTDQRPGDDLEFRELLDEVRYEVARLPARQGEAFWLFCIEELSAADVAEQLGTDANTVGVLVHRARARLRETLTNMNPTRAHR
jgi:RNA polymerase sigma-70 factor (ECF subfamily)